MKIKTKILILTIITSAVYGITVAGFDFSRAQEQRTIDVSAYIVSSENKPVINGEYEVRFTLYNVDRKTADPYPSNADAGKKVWEETQKIIIYNGILDAYLGTVTPLPETLTLHDTTFYLGIRIGQDSEMVPRKKIGSVPSAINSYFLRGATTGTAAGNIPQLGTGGKMNISLLPTGNSGKKLMLANNSRLHDEMSLAGSYDYLTLSGQEITLGQIDLTTDVTGTLTVASGGTNTTTVGDAGAVVYSDGTGYSFTDQGTAGQVLVSAGSGEPVWGAVSGGIITPDSLDFTELADAMTLDDDLSIDTDSHDFSITGTLSVDTLSADSLIISGEATIGMLGLSVSVSSSLIPSDPGLNLGSAANHWANLYVDNISVGESDLNGTTSEYFAINTDAVAEETMGVRFYRGSVPNGYAALVYTAGTQDFSLYQKESAATLADLNIDNLSASGSGDNYFAGNVGIGTSSPEFKLSLDDDGGILAKGTYGSGTTLATTGAGTRLIWYPKKAAFRAGSVTGTQWDDVNIGIYSIAMGQNAKASGAYSIAMGASTTASGSASVAMGSGTASGVYSVVMGREAVAGGADSLAMGMGTETTSSGAYAVAIGQYAKASGVNAVAIGQNLTAGTAANTIVLGQGASYANQLINNTASSLMIGFNSTVPTLFVGPSAGAGTTGKVGIGKAAPSYKLDIATSTANDRGINIAHTATTGINLGIYSQVSGGGATSNTGGYFVGSGASTDYGVYGVAMDNSGSTGYALYSHCFSLGTCYGLKINMESASQGAYGIDISNISTSGTAAYGINMGTLTGGTAANYQINTGAITAVASASNYGINLGGITGTAASSTNYGINIGTINSTGTADYGLHISQPAGATHDAALVIGTVATTAGDWALYSSSTADSYFAGNVGIGTATPRTRLELGNDGAILAIGTYSSGWTEPNLGGGTRMMWYPKKAAFRAGYVSGTQWNDTSIGNYSVAMGYMPTASGQIATSIGMETNASGSGSLAMGGGTIASNSYSTAIGYYSTASGQYSLVLGKNLTAGSANYSMVLGQGVDNTNRLVNNTASSLMIGFNSTIPTLFVGPSAGAGTTGNVGIGTATPEYKMDVNGSLRAALSLTAGINIETLSAGKTLTAGTDKMYQYLNPGAANKIITLATANALAGDRFIIRHTGTYDSSVYLAIQQAAIVLDYIYAGGFKEFVFDGTNWISGGIGTGENTTEKVNVTVGYNASGWYYGTAVGYGANAYQGAAVGYNALGYNQGAAVGHSAQGYNFGTAVGQSAIGNTSGAAVGNLASGHTYGVAVGASTFGYSYGVAVGYGARGRGYGVSLGYRAGNNSSLGVDGYNILTGAYSGYQLTTGIGNIITGYQAGYDATYSPTTGSKNILIGYQAGTPATDTSNFLNIGNLIFATGVNTATGAGISAGNVGIGQTTPTAYLHLKAGTASVSTAPLKFTSGTLLTTPEAGAVEFLTDAFYGTITTGAARKQFAFTDSAMTGTFDGINLATGNQGGVPYFSTTTQLTSSAAGTSGQALISGGTGAPTWFTPVAGSILFAGTGGILAEDNSGLYFNSTSNYLGIGTASPSVALHIGSESPAQITSANSVFIQGELEVGETIFLGPMEFPTDAGAVSWIDMPVVSASDNTPESYTAYLDGNPMLTVYGLADGSGGMDNLGVGIGTTAPTAGLHINPTLTLNSNYTSFKSGLIYNGASAMTNWYGAYIAAPTGTGTITNKYALVTEANAGNVGIGTTGPAARLDIRGSGSEKLRLYDMASSSDGIYMYNSEGTGIGTITRQSIGGTADLAISAYGGIGFKGGSGGAPTSYGMYLTSVGNVGIGTVAPSSSYKMHIVSPYNQGLVVDSTTGYSSVLIKGSQHGRFEVQDTGATSGSQVYQLISDGGSFEIRRTNDDITVVNATPFAIKNDNVGINTTGPDRKLDILDAANPQLRLTYTDNTIYSDLQTGANGGVALTGSSLTVNGAIGFSNSFTIANATGSASQYGEKLVLTSTGATAATLYGKHISFVDATSTANTVYGLYVDASTANASDTQYAAAFMSGNVGIGITAPTALLHLDGSAGKVSLEINSNETTAASNVLMLRSDVASADDPIFRVQADGAVFADGAYTGTGADYAEYFATKDTDLKSGEAVCVDARKDNAVKRCARSGDNDIMGIVSSHPSIVGNSADGREKDPNYKVIGMLGQIAANISGENGNIQIGDSLTSADTPGYLRKADAGESTVGVALQKFDGGQGSIQILISRRNKSLTVEKVEEAVTQRIADMNVQDQVDKMIAGAAAELAKNTETQLMDIGGRVITLETLANGYAARIKSQEDLTAQLQTQIDELKRLANEELNVAQISANTNDIDYLKLVLGLDRAENGSVHLLGNLEADEVIAGVFTVKIVDPEAKTIGSATLEVGKQSVVVSTKAVSSDSRIFVTPAESDPQIIQKTIEQENGDSIVIKVPITWSVVEQKSGESFTVKTSDPVSIEMKFNWWIVEEK